MHDELVQMTARKRHREERPAHKHLEDHQALKIMKFMMLPCHNDIQRPTCRWLTCTWGHPGTPRAPGTSPALLRQCVVNVTCTHRAHSGSHLCVWTRDKARHAKVRQLEHARVADEQVGRCANVDRVVRAHHTRPTLEVAMDDVPAVQEEHT